jgi:hypothetical protein
LLLAPPTFGGYYSCLYYRFADKVLKPRLLTPITTVLQTPLRGKRGAADVKVPKQSELIHWYLLGR